MIRAVMEAVRTSETLLYFNDIAQRYVPEGCHFHTDRREKMKLHIKPCSA
jgi:hypothetical protein